MPSQALHAWDVTYEEAAHIQLELRGRLLEAWDGRKVCSLAGADAHPGGAPNRLRAAVVVLRFPELELLASPVVEVDQAFPYIPGQWLSAKRRRCWRPGNGCRCGPTYCCAMGMEWPTRVGWAWPLTWACGWICPPSAWRKRIGPGA